MGYESAPISEPKKMEAESLGSVERAKQEAMRRLAGHSFVTEKGSTYKYDDKGRTSRFKTKTGEQHEAQDITVFLDLSDKESRYVLDAIFTENPELKKKIHIAERSENGESKIVKNFANVNDPRNLYMVILDKEGKIVGSKKASLKPTIGYTVFDMRHFKNGDNWEAERHLGHKVIEIN